MATTTNFSQLAYYVASELRTIREGSLTTLSTTVPADTGRTESADYWNNGGFWITYTGTTTAPLWENTSITDFTAGTGSSGGVFTLHSALTTVPPATSKYAVCRRRYPLDVIQDQINVALRELGHVPLTDISLVTLANTTQYTIPQDAREDLLQVWVQTQIVYTNVKGYMQIPHGAWRQELDTLYLPQLSAYPYILKLVYGDEHPALSLYSDTLSDYVHPSRVVYKAAANVLMWRAERINDTASANAINQKVNYFLDMDQKARLDHPIILPKKQDPGNLAGVDFTGGSRDATRMNVKPGYVRITPE